MDITVDGFDKLLIMILMFFGPASIICIVICGLAQMSKPSTWMTRFCYRLSIALIVMCAVVIFHQISRNNENTTLLGGAIIAVVIFGIVAFGFKFKLNWDKSTYSTKG